MRMRGSFCCSKACKSDSIIKIQIIDILFDYAKLVIACARWTAIREHTHKAVVLNLGNSVGNISLNFKNVATFMFASLLSQNLRLSAMVQSHTCYRVKSSECHLCLWTYKRILSKTKLSNSNIWKNISNYRIIPVIWVKMKRENSVLTNLLLSTDCSECLQSWRLLLQTFFNSVSFQSWPKIPEAENKGHRYTISLPSLPSISRSGKSSNSLVFDLWILRTLGPARVHQ